jgi:hypothetical protein
MDRAENAAFGQAVNREIEAEFDKVWPREQWFPFKDEHGKMHGIAWGWSFFNGELRLNVSGAGDSQQLFEDAICRALRRVVTRAQKQIQRNNARSRGQCIICLRNEVAPGRSTCDSCSVVSNRRRRSATLSDCIFKGWIDAGVARRMVEAVAEHQRSGKSGYMAFGKNGIGPPFYGYDLPFKGSALWLDSFIVQVEADVDAEKLVTDSIIRAQPI